MIGITGIPGSGKSSVCVALRRMGYDCRGVLDINGAKSCLEGEEMDIDCLREKLHGEEEEGLIIEGHYSHLLGCSMVFILQRPEGIILKVLRERKYPESKISENLDALRSDIIYQESLEFLPASRIHRIDVEEGNPEKAVLRIVEFLRHAKKD